MSKKKSTRKRRAERRKNPSLKKYRDPVSAVVKNSVTVTPPTETVTNETPVKKPPVRRKTWWRKIVKTPKDWWGFIIKAVVRVVVVTGIVAALVITMTIPVGS